MQGGLSLSFIIIKVMSSQFISLSLFAVSASPSIFLITKCLRITGCYLLKFHSSSFHLLGPDYAINCLKLREKLYNPVSSHVRKLKVLSGRLPGFQTHIYFSGCYICGWIAGLDFS